MSRVQYQRSNYLVGAIVVGANEFMEGFVAGATIARVDLAGTRKGLVANCVTVSVAVDEHDYFYSFMLSFYKYNINISL